MTRLVLLLYVAALCFAQPASSQFITKTTTAADAVYLQVDCPGKTTTFLMGVASNGRMTGFCSDAPAMNSAPSQYLNTIGFVLQDGKVSYLTTPDPSDASKTISTYPLKIRVNGVVTGWSAPGTEPSADEIGWVWRHGRFEQVLYTGPDYPGLDPLVTYWKVTDVMSINGRGDMIGQVGWINPADVTPIGSHWRGWLYQKGVFQLIDPPGAMLTYPADINERGEIVGLYRGPAGRKGFLRAPNGTLTDIVAPGTPFLTFPQAISNSGEIVGFYANTPGFPRGFQLKRGVFTEIMVPDSADTVVYGVDETGLMVGAFKDAAGAVHGFIRIPNR